MLPFKMKFKGRQRVFIDGVGNQGRGHAGPGIVTGSNNKRGFWELAGSDAGSGCCFTVISL